MTRWIAELLVSLAAGLVIAGPAGAHRLAPSLLAIEEAADGTLAVSFKTPRERPIDAPITPELPPRCEALEPTRVEADETSVTLRWTAHCGADGIVGGSVAVRGLAESATNALIRIALRDGRLVQAVLHGGEPSLVVPARATALGVFRDYLGLGIEHIATGFDHLLFVFGLLLLAARVRPVIATVTAFTAGHSVTLSIAALGIVRFPSGPIEVVIAATILTLAVELARDPPAPDSMLRRRPWIVAFGFGLLHGFGFAGALAEIGLPQEEIPMALFSFNAGIEVGQVAFVGCVVASRALLAPALRSAPAWLLRAPVTAMGALAAYWCIERTAALF